MQTTPSIVFLKVPLKREVYESLKKYNTKCHNQLLNGLKELGLEGQYSTYTPLSVEERAAFIIEKALKQENQLKAN